MTIRRPAKRDEVRHVVRSRPGAVWPAEPARHGPVDRRRRSAVAICPRFPPAVSRTRSARQTVTPPLERRRIRLRRPAGEQLYAVGDIHGRLDLLDALLGRIADDLEARPVDGARLAFLGDFIDRGPHPPE